MRLGLIHINMGPMSSPDALVQAARAAEQAEFAAVGVHRLVLLAPPDPDGPARTIEAGTAAVAGLP